MAQRMPFHRCSLKVCKLMKTFDFLVKKRVHRGAWVNTKIFQKIYCLKIKRRKTYQYLTPHPERLRSLRVISSKTLGTKYQNKLNQCGLPNEQKSYDLMLVYEKLDPTNSKTCQLIRKCCKRL